ncbi:MAG TPA: hypothetical protein VI750_02505 [Pyrinomonadaceae bacterium]|nr:hypothetical protein [Pyrinomonadaceae bacterium]
MPSTKMKILQLALLSLLIFSPVHSLITTTAQTQATRETSQPRKPDNNNGTATSLPAIPAPPAVKGSSDDANSEIIRQMLRRIEELEARIRELEARQGEKATAPAGATNTTTTEVLNLPAPSPIVVNNGPVAAQGGATTHDAHQDLPSGTPRLQIQGFADVNYRATNEKGRNNSFLLGQLDLFITSRLSEKFSILSELILEAGEDNAFTFEIHRLLLKYSLNDYFNLSAGRYHTGIGYYNTAYHHGSFFQTTANRPFLFAFESRGGLLPLHNVGLSLTGRIPSAPLGLRYIAEIGNGRAARSPLARPVQTVSDENNGKSFNLGVFARPAQVPGLQTGFSVYRDRLTPSGSPVVGQTIMAGHLIYQTAHTELLNEALFFRHSIPGRVFYTPGFYTQISRRFGHVRPFFRYQYVNVPGGDPIYSAVGRRNGPSVGFRYDLSDFVNFKAQYDRTARRRLSALDELILQLAFTF